MNVSVIVPTYNGIDSIPFLLESLKKLQFKEFTLIVVVDGSTDQTLKFLNSIGNTEFHDLLIIDQANAGRAEARNRGVKSAKNGLLIFLDDDIIVPSNLLEIHIAHHTKNTDSILSIGSWMDSTRAKSSFDRYRLEMEDQWRKNQNLHGKSRVTKENLFFSGSNMSVSKSLFEDLGGLDSQLKDNEDFDFALRALLKGIDVYYDSTIKSIHNDMADFDAYLNRIVQYKNSYLDLKNLKPEYYLSEYKPANRSLLKTILLTIFKSIGGKKLYKTMLFKGLPYFAQKQIYDAIISIELAKV